MFNKYILFNLIIFRNILFNSLKMIKRNDITEDKTHRS